MAGNSVTELVKLATRLILQEEWEAQTRDALGRSYYSSSEHHMALHIFLS